MSFHERDEVDRNLREELGASRVFSTPFKGLWPIYSNRRSSVLGGYEAPPCKSIKFGVTDTIGALESGNLSRCCVTEVSGGVEESDFTSGDFSTLEAIAKKRADDRDGAMCDLSSGDGVVRVPRVESISELDGVGGEKREQILSEPVREEFVEGFLCTEPDDTS